MQNNFKGSEKRGWELQVTHAVREAGMVEEAETPEDTNAVNPTYQADVRMFAFDGLLLVFDIDRVSTVTIAKTVASAARDSGSIYRAFDGSVAISGHGYKIHLPNAPDAGFEMGDTAKMLVPGSGCLIIYAKGYRRFADDLATNYDELRGG